MTESSKRTGREKTSEWVRGAGGTLSCDQSLKLWGTFLLPFIPLLVWWLVLLIFAVVIVPLASLVVHYHKLGTTYRGTPLVVVLSILQLVVVAALLPFGTLVGLLHLGGGWWLPSLFLVDTSSPLVLIVLAFLV